MSGFISGVQSGDPEGHKFCGDGAFYPNSCWRYCSGDSGDWCWTDEGVSCHSQTHGMPQGNCIGRDCYKSSC